MNLTETIPWPQLQPTLETQRLILRAYTPDDAEDLQCLVSDFAIADTTLNIPHPYPDGAAAKYIAELAPKYAQQTNVCFAVTLKRDGKFIGAVSLQPPITFRRAELGYWIGQPYWNQGYMSEAAAAAVQFGFDTLKLHKLTSGYFARNAASARVQQKIGFVQEGILRQHVIRWNRFEDLVVTAKFAPN